VGELAPLKRPGDDDLDGATAPQHDEQTSLREAVCVALRELRTSLPPGWRGSAAFPAVLAIAAFLLVAVILLILAVLLVRALGLGRLAPQGLAEADAVEPRLPRVWHLFPFILPRKVRREVYEPACEELKQDYIEAQSLATTPWARRWLTFAFTVRTVGLVLGSLHAAVGDRVVTFIAKLMGEATKRLLGG